MKKMVSMICELTIFFQVSYQRWPDIRKNILFGSSLYCFPYMESSKNTKSVINTSWRNKKTDVVKVFLTLSLTFVVRNTKIRQTSDLAKQLLQIRSL